jgi:hypothetical protein
VFRHYGKGKITISFPDSVKNLAVPIYDVFENIYGRMKIGYDL